MNKTRFEKDLENRRLTIERRFDAPRSRVWEAYTNTDILDQWWAPKPWKTETDHVEFRVGGHWFYSMNGPEGEKHYCRMDYTDIQPEEHYAAVDVFCDESGTALPDMPTQSFVTTFFDEGKTTRVVSVVDYDSVEDLKKIIEMGMQEGLTMAQDQLEEMLAAA